MHPFRNLRRLREIAGVLARHGFGHLVQKMGLRRFLPFRRRLAKGAEERAWSPARRAAAACQQLGPAFVKLGQMLANRPDLLPPEWIEELRVLHDRVEPFDTDLAIARIAEELGAPVEQLFAAFDRTPFAAGSLAQCYRATGHDGRPLAVKVKRPGIERTLLLDLELLESLARLLERRLPEVRIYRPVMVAEELARSTKWELDFVSEASSTERLRKDFARFDRVGVPRVHWRYTTSNVVTFDRLEGENLQTLLDRPDSALDRKAIARLLCDLYMHQFFVTGFFHADPHPGNLLVVPPDRLNLVDFGMMGHLTGRMKDELATMVVAVVTFNLEVMVDVFEEIGAAGPDTRSQELKLEILRTLDKYYALPAGRLDLVRVFNELSDAARRHQVVLPREFVLLGRAFVTVAALAMRLDPDLNIAEVVRPHIKHLLLEKVSPTHLSQRLLEGLRQVGALLGRAPADLRALTRKAARGELQLTVQHRRLEDLTGEINRAGNRLALAVTVAGLVVAASLLVSRQVGPHPFGIPLLGLGGYVLAGLLGLWLLAAIFRSGRL